MSFNFAELMGSLLVCIGMVGKEGFSKMKETGTSMDDIEYFMLIEVLVYSKNFTSLTINFSLPLLEFLKKAGGLVLKSKKSLLSH